jgi:signal transduction histidine kinase
MYMQGIIHYFQHLFDTTGYVKRGECGGWTPDLAILENLSDLLTWGAYIAIPIVLLYAARHKRDLPFRHLFWLFGLFIAACGTTHFMTYVTTIFPAYRLEGVIKLVTALASWGTVMAIAAIAPKAFDMKMPEELEREVVEKERARAELAMLNESLIERTAELERANKDLEGFNYMVAHDLRAPLRGIVAASRMITDDMTTPLDSATVYRLGRLSASALRMSALVDDLLEFSRLGRYTVQKRDVGLSQIAKGVARELESEYPKVKFEIEPRLSVEADPSLIQLVIFNLMENACKYGSDERDPFVRVFSTQTERGRAICVEDNGIGFDMSFSNKIFQPFERLHREEIPGTGIGLAIVHRIVEKHGGELWAESTEGVGSKFFFTTDGIHSV